mgnify:CR=1 FL=1
MNRIKPPTDAHLAKLQDLLSVVKDIEQEVYDATSILTMKSDAVLNGKLASLKQVEDTSASMNNNESMIAANHVMVSENPDIYKFV